MDYFAGLDISMDEISRPSARARARGRSPTISLMIWLKLSRVYWLGPSPQTPPELFFPLSNGGPQNWLLGIAARVGTSEDSREPD